MLKIKDNINLEELKKFGFEKYKNEYVYIEDCSAETLCVQENRYLYFKLDHISIYGAIVEDLLSKLFDLIQVGFVEKDGE